MNHEDGAQRMHERGERKKFQGKGMKVSNDVHSYSAVCCVLCAVVEWFGSSVAPRKLVDRHCRSLWRRRRVMLAFGRMSRLGGKARPARARVRLNLISPTNRKKAMTHFREKDFEKQRAVV